MKKSDNVIVEEEFVLPSYGFPIPRGWIKWRAAAGFGNLLGHGTLTVHLQVAIVCKATNTYSVGLTAAVWVRLIAVTGFPGRFSGRSL